MIACGIDPSLTSTGVAVLVDGRPAHYARYGRDGQNGASYTSRSRRVRKMIREATDAALSCGTPHVFVIEEQIGVRFSGSEFDRSAVWHGIFGNLDARNIPGVVVGNKTAKAWVTGAGGATKDDVIAVIDDWYDGRLAQPLASWRKKDNPDDVADALSYATMGAYKLGDPIPFEPKERHRTALALLPWPKIARAR